MELIRIIKLWAKEEKQNKKPPHSCPKAATELNYHVFLTPVGSIGELQMETFLSNPLLLLKKLRVSVLTTSHIALYFSLPITS